MQPPNLLERNYLRLDGAGGAAQTILRLSLGMRLDPALLRGALAAAAADWPLLDSVVVRRPWGYTRRAARFDAAAWAEAVVVADAPEGEEAEWNRRLDLGRCPPVRLVLMPDGERCRLTALMHHSLTDGAGQVLLLDRLGAHYHALASGSTPAAPPRAEGPAGYRHYWLRLAPRDRARAVAGAVGLLVDALVQKRRSPDCASFTDLPLPGSGALRGAALAVSAERMRSLRRAAVKRRVSLSTVFMALGAWVGRRVWPRDQALPVRLSVPISMRRGPATDLANRTVGYTFDIRCLAADDIEAVLKQTEAGLAAARATTEPIVQSLRWSSLSVVPPAVFDRFVQAALVAPTNARETFTFTSLAVPQGPALQRFGDAPIDDVTAYTSVLAPPGFKFSLITNARGATVCVSYLEPLVSERSVRDWLRRMDEALAGLQ